MSDALRQAFGMVLADPAVWAAIIAAAVYGVFMGAVPGLTATMALALLVSATYFMPPVVAIAAVVTLVACAIFAGDIPNALLRLPGTPASAAYADDVYRLTLAGRAEQTLGVCLVFSVVGGLIGALILIFLAQPLAAVATSFSVAEYFWLYLMGLSCAVTVSRGSTAHAALGLIMGLLLSTVGLSAVHTQARFTFGQPELFQGINFIPAMIGLFGFSEILRNLLRIDAAEPSEAPPRAARAAGDRTVLARLLVDPAVAVIGSAVPLVVRRKGGVLRSSLIGSAIGMLPGAGADIAAWVSLAVSKRLSATPEQYGRGSLEGIGDASTANSAALAGAWIPALVFGIPGDSVTAIVIGVLLMKNITPGPDIFQDNAALVWSIYLVFILANLVLLPVGLLAIRIGRHLIHVPRRVLLPIILLFCVVGAYAINSSYFDIGVMGAMGLLGFVLERRGVPLGPVVLGIILGGPLEERFVQTISSADSTLSAFFGRPLAAALGVATLLVWLGPLLAALRRRYRRRAGP